VVYFRKSLLALDNYNFQVLSTVERLNGDDNVHGIIVQLPLDSQNPIDSSLATNAVSPEKDVDG